MEEINAILKEAIEILEAKGYKVPRITPAVIHGTNDIDPPEIFVCAPPKHRITTTPKMWCHAHGKESRSRVMNKYCFTIRFSFSPDHPQNEEALHRLMEKRYDCLRGWATQLQEVEF